MKLFVQNEKNLLKKEKLDDFNKVLSEYESLGHAEKVPQEDLSKPVEKTYFLPMHGVFKASSSTTKLCIVFDASAKTSNGLSLTDLILPGPSLYPMITSLIIKFRTHKIAISSDISKMFGEIVLNPEHSDFHQFLRRISQGQIEDWRMLRLTFGVSSSPYLASQILRQIAHDHENEYQKASSVVKTNFYVDDCLSGAELVKHALDLQSELFAMLKKGGMVLRKWRSNSSEFMSAIPEEYREKEPVLSLSGEQELGLKTLGVHWNTTSDHLTISVPEFSNSVPTKRSIASTIAKMYDSLGWISPAVVKVKILLQDIWRTKQGWDEPVQEPILSQWNKWNNEISVLKTIEIPRKYLTYDSPVLSQTLHGFSDASEKAFGAVLYLRTVYQDTTISTSLVISKTKVASIHKLSIPKLELSYWPKSLIRLPKI